MPIALVVLLVSLVLVLVPNGASTGESDGEGPAAPVAAAGEDLGVAYFHGIGRPVDYGLARKHLLLSAKNGEFGASYLLGELYREGLDTRRDPKTALHWFRAATKSGHPMAPRAVAEMYLDGELAAYDSKTRALAWYVIGMYMGDTDSGRAVQRLYMTLPTDAVRKAARKAEAIWNDLSPDLLTQ